MNGIEPLRRDLLDTATTTLTRAFADEPMFTWVIPDPQHRARSLRVMNRGPLLYGLRYGHAMQLHHGKAVAAWLPPHCALTALRTISCGILGVPFSVGLHAFRRFRHANEVLARIHRKHVPEPHWYLMVVGVDPEFQGRGLGTALVNEGLARADRDNVAVLPRDRRGAKSGLLRAVRLHSGGDRCAGARRSPGMGDATESRPRRRHHERCEVESEGKSRSGSCIARPQCAHELSSGYSLPDCIGVSRWSVWRRNCPMREPGVWLDARRSGSCCPRISVAFRSQKRAARRRRIVDPP